MKIHQNGCKKSFFDVQSEAQKDLEDASVGIGIFIWYIRILLGLIQLELIADTEFFFLGGAFFLLSCK
jgi:hypothetical protein